MVNKQNDKRINIEEILGYYDLINSIRPSNDLSDLYSFEWDIGQNYKTIPLNVQFKLDLYLLISARKTITEIYESYISLFDRGFERYIGWKKPSNMRELLEFFVELKRKEEQGKHMHWLILDKNEEIIGIIYFYDYKSKYKKTKLTIGLTPNHRGKGLGVEIIKSIIQVFMVDDPEKSYLTRLECAIEPGNTSSIKMIENNFKEFNREGYQKNVYGYGFDSIVYAYTL